MEARFVKKIKNKKIKAITKKVVGVVKIMSSEIRRPKHGPFG